MSDSERFTDILNAVYAEAMHWKMNFFKVPYSELARLLKAFATGSALEFIAMKAATFMPLLLQKPAHKSKAEDHITCLERRLSTWVEGDLNELLMEGRTIQEPIPGVLPIGIGDTARHIIAKAILNITRQDVQEVAGSVQLCAGQIPSIEAAIHAIRSFSREKKQKLFC